MYQPNSNYMVQMNALFPNVVTMALQQGQINQAEAQHVNAMYYQNQ